MMQQLKQELERGGGNQIHCHCTYVLYVQYLCTVCTVPIYCMYSTYILYEGLGMMQQLKQELEGGGGVGNQIH